MSRVASSGRHAGAALAVLLVAALGGRHAGAQTSSPDARTRALELLRDAEQLASSGDTAEACVKYRDSASLDAQLDALLPWASCLEKEGKLASAYAAYGDAVDVARRSGDPRAGLAEQAVERLRTRVSFLTIDVPSAGRLPGLSVERDGFRVGSSSWGVPLPIDPAQHVIVVRAFGYRDFQTTLDVNGESQQLSVEVPLLEKDAAAPAVTAPAAPPSRSAPVLPPPVTVPPRRAPFSAAAARAPASAWSAPRIIALSAAGASVIGLGLGVYFLNETHGTLDERDGICPSGKACEPGTNQRLADLTSEARSQQRAEIACFVLGGASAALAAGLWLWPRTEHGDRRAFVAPVLAPSTAGLVLGGRL
jgi:hypothetical protein